VLGTRIVLLSRKSLAELPSFAPLIKEVPRRSGEFCGRWQPLRDSPHPPIAGRWPTIERR
jgi:hypothetical protein